LTATLIGMVRSEAGMDTVSCVLLRYVVGRFEPFHCTTEFRTKLLPVTVKLAGPVPTARAVGEIEVRVGDPGGDTAKFAEA